MKYTKKIVERICELISSDSYTIREVCRIVGISVSLFYHWKDTKLEFLEAIKKAEKDFDELVAVEAGRSLMKKIRGYTVQEKKTVSVDTGKLDEDGKPVVRVKEHVVTDRHFQPDTAAIIFALTNREPEKWRNKQNMDVTSNGNDINGTQLIFSPTPLSAGDIEDIKNLQRGKENSANTGVSEA
jgi:transposase-like protein